MLAGPGRLQPWNAAGERRFRCIPQLDKPLDQLLCPIDIAESARKSRMPMMKTMQVIARVENDEGIVHVARKTWCLSHFGDMTEAMHESDEARADALERLHLVQHDVNGARRSRRQQPRQSTAALR